MTDRLRIRQLTVHWKGYTSNDREHLFPTFEALSCFFFWEQSYSIKITLSVHLKVRLFSSLYSFFLSGLIKSISDVFWTLSVLKTKLRILSKPFLKMSIKGGKITNANTRKQPLQRPFKKPDYFFHIPCPYVRPFSSSPILNLIISFAAWNIVLCEATSIDYFYVRTEHWT